MRILYVNDYKKFSGTENFVADCIKWMKAHDHEVEFVAPPRDIPPFGEENVKAIVDSFEPEIVHFNNICIVGTENVNYVAKKDIPYLLTMHDYYPVCRARTFLINDTMRCNNRNWGNCQCPHRMVNIRGNQDIFDSMEQGIIITICEYMEKILREFGYSGNVETVLDGVDLSMLDPNLIRDGHNNQIMWSGRVCPEKGFSFYVKLASILEEWVKPILTVSQEIDPKTIPPKIDYKGRMPKEDYYKEMGSSAFFLLTTLWPEPAALPQIEAQARGTPVIYFNDGGLPEYIPDGISGIAIEPYDVYDMAETIEMCINNEKWWRELSKGAVKHAHENLTLERQMKDYMKVYNRLIG